jgi:hypothetical protein
MRVITREEVLKHEAMFFRYALEIGGMVENIGCGVNGPRLGGLGYAETFVCVAACPLHYMMGLES